MEIKVMSEREAIDYAADTSIPTTAIVSITNPDREVHFAENPKIADVLHISFYDTVEEERNAIQLSDGSKIAEFFEKYKNSVEVFVIHCTEGISRSAGVCAAILRHYKGRDHEIFEDDKYMPNHRCYRMMIKAFNEIREKRNEPSLTGRRYHGLFWVIEEYYHLVNKYESHETPYIPEHEDERDVYHSVWERFTDPETEDMRYDYYPHGKVEVSENTAYVYMPRLFDRERIEEELGVLITEFMLYPECGVDHIRVKFSEA